MPSIEIQGISDRGGNGSSRHPEHTLLGRKLAVSRLQARDNGGSWCAASLAGSNTPDNINYHAYVRDRTARQGALVAVAHLALRGYAVDAVTVCQE